MTRYPRLLTLLLAIALSVGGVMGGARTIEASDPIVTGVLHSESYPFAPMMRNSFAMALDRINEQGGIKGRPLQLAFADDKSQREAGEDAVRRLVQDAEAIMLVGAAGGFTHHRFIDMAVATSEGLLTATLWTPNLPYPGALEFYRRYEEDHSAPPDDHGAEAYSALFVVADVLKRAESHSPEAVRAALDETKLETAAGPIEFETYDRFERQNGLPAVVLKVANKAFEVKWSEDIATSKLTLPTK